MKLSHRWKQASPRAKVLLALGLVALLGTGAYVLRMGGNGKQEAPADEAVPVVLEKIRTHSFAETVEAQGTLRAKHFALVSPKVDGPILEVYVREGDRVTAGKTPLFRIDDLKLREAEQIAQKDLAAARFAREERGAALQRAAIELDRAAKEYRRFQALHEEDVVSQSGFDDVESRYRQMASMRDLSRSTLKAAGENVRKADAALRIAQKNLRDSLVLSPLTGVVSKRLAEPGETGKVGTPVVRVDDPRLLEAVVFVPGQFYARIQEGRTRVQVSDSGGAWSLEVPVATKSPVVDPTLRTFEARALLSGDAVRVPGALVNLSFLLNRREGPGVPTASVLERAGGKVVFVSDGKTARMVPVRTGLVTNGWTEVLSGDLKPGDAVVAQGQFLLNPGAPVRVQKGN